MDMSNWKDKFGLRIETKWQYLYSFFTPIAIILIAFVFAGLAPFGKRNLMAMDGYAQYFPMLREYVRAKSDWSFAGALGFNQLTQSAYYTNSPLWMLLHLAPEQYTIEAIHFIVILRFGLAGLSFAYYIKRNFEFRSKFLFVFSTAYALSAYTLTFINQFMWMDIVILLPLLASSLQRLWKENQFLPYILVLATALYSNFYLAYILCLFAGLWSLYLIFRQKYSAQKRLLYLFKFVLASFMSAGLVAFILLPTYLGLQKTLAAGLGMPDKLKLYHPIWKYLLHLLPMQKISLEYEVANIYSGLISFILAILYIFQKRRTIREKCIFSLFFVGSYFSFNLNILDYLWHGFHFPNQLPARQSFLFIFVLLTFAYKAYSEKNFIIHLQAKETYKKKKRFNLKIFISIVFLFEILVNSVFTLTAYTWKADHNQYTKYEKELHHFTEKYAPLDNEFYRMEFLQPVHNQGLRYGYNGLGYYSSLMSGQCYEFFKNIGMDIYAKSVSTNYVPDALLNNIFAVRYLIQINDDPVDIEGLNLKKIEEQDDLTLYENPNYFSIGFSVKEMDFRGTKASQIRDQFGQSLNTSLQSNDVSFLMIDEFAPDRIRGKLSLDQDSQLLTSIGSEEGWKIIVDGTDVNTFIAFDYLLAAPIKAGKHEILLIYETPGKSLGSLITCGSIILLFIWLWVDRCKRRYNAVHEIGFVRRK